MNRFHFPLRAPALLAGVFLLCPLVSFATGPVTLTEVDEVIPTYLSGPPDPNPMFYFGRDSQGAEGRIYPYPLYDNLTNRKGEQSYHLVYLENEFVKIGIAPQLGGRLFSALDKTNGYDFVYRQHVIKPALIGLVGAWISGGIEWNIPHHHRASTFNPVQYRTEENADGSKTVWVGELEIRHRLRWAVGYTLHPGSSVLTCSVRIVNRTPAAATMLCFANVAVNTNEHYQIIFPPSTQWVTYHKKNEFASWPVATTRYNGADFSAGVDVSWYKNHQAANSMFAWNYADDFFAGYDHGKAAGTMSIADHHLVPGKKFWTWGNGTRGRMWDGILTDTDGPYIELMVGAYSDNQPDYSWLQPFETRAFEMNWYPFREIGGVKNANLEAAVNLDVKDGRAKFGFSVTKAFPAASVSLRAGGKVLFEEKIAIDPAKPYAGQCAVPAAVDGPGLRLALTVEGREIVGYTPLAAAPMAMPEAVKPAPAPGEIKTAEELFLAGQRVDQFHDPRREADPFWEEALRRDPGDSAAHTGLGLLALRRANFAEAEQHFRSALARLTANYTTPKNAEPFYYLGVALQAQEKTAEAFDAFSKAAWSQEWKAPANFALAEIATARGDFPAALDFANRSLDANALNVRAYGLKSALLRHLGRPQEAIEVLAVARAKTDPLDVRLAMENVFADSGRGALAGVSQTLRDHPATALETAVEYMNAGLWDDAGKVVGLSLDASGGAENASPLLSYLAGEIAEKLGDTGKAAAARWLAAAASPAYVFPFQAELIPVLRRAMVANPQDARAPYSLGNLLFDWQPAEATRLWEKSAELDPAFPIVWRNLAQAYSHQVGDGARERAMVALEKAVALGEDYPTHFAELDDLYQVAGIPVEKRLALLEKHQATVAKKDEGLASLIALKTFVGKADEAIALVQGRTFSVWEGGTRFNTGESWTNAHLVRGLQSLAAKKYAAALADFEVALKFPANLRASETFGGASRQAEIAYWTGCAQEGSGHPELARAAWEAAVTPVRATGRPAGGRGGFANPIEGRTPYYQALARQKLGQPEEALKVLRELVASGSALLQQISANHETAADFGWHGAPGARIATARYVTGLGWAGQGETEKARAEFSAALAAQPDHLGSKLALERL